MRLIKTLPIFMIGIFLMVVLSACGDGVKAFDDAEEYISSVEELTIPADVKIIGFGEATHGNVELQELKKDVFEALIHNEDVRVFVLEADFGGGQEVNQFISEGKGTAEEVVSALDYDIYKTEQMIDLVQWMHDYNAEVSEDEKIYFYGIDMQRYDSSKKGLLAYYEKVNHDNWEKYTVQLETVSNKTMRSLTTNQLEGVSEALDHIMLDLQENEEAYIEHSSPESFAIALRYAQMIKQRTELFLNEGDYMQLRDQYLADNLQWIVEFEAVQGHDKVFVTGHNGHIEKTSASLASYDSMGSYLDKEYGDQYFAIGTDLMKSEFQALNRKANDRKRYNIKNNNDLVGAFREVEPNIFYVDFEKASESKQLSDLLSSKQKMVNIGDDFRSWQKLLKMFYTIEMIPNEAYDSIIILKDATPTEVIH